MLKDLSEYLQHKYELSFNLSENDTPYEALLKFIEINERKILSNIKFDISVHKDVSDKYKNLDDGEKIVTKKLYLI